MGGLSLNFKRFVKKSLNLTLKVNFKVKICPNRSDFFFCMIISRLSWIKYLKDVPSILISESENSIQRMDCKDKIPYKKCKKYKQRGKCEEKKIRKKCMLTCEICTPGTTDNFQLESDSKWIRQKFYQFFINKKFKKILYFLSAFYLIMCLMKITFEKIDILKKWQLISFWGVKIHFGEKYAWFAIEILVHGSKTCLLYMLWFRK